MSWCTRSPLKYLLKALQVSISDVMVVNDDILPDAFHFALGFKDAWLLEWRVDDQHMELVDSQ
jgi:hypothetical protein